LQLSGVFLGLGGALGVGQVAALRLDDGEFVVAVGQDVVGDLPGGAFAGTLQAAEGDDFAADTACLDDAPAGGF
jgi:hypothetical protein